MTNNLKILIPVINQTDANFASSLGVYFRNNGFDVVLVPEDPGRRDISIESRYVSDHHSHEPRKSLQHYLSKYDIKNPKEMIITEMVYDLNYPMLCSRSAFSKENMRRYIDKLHRLLSFFDMFYSDEGGGTPVQNIGGEILRRSLRIVSEYHGYDNVWIGFSPVEHSHSLFTNEYVEWTSFRKNFDIDLSDRKKEEAQDFLEEYIHSKRRIIHNESLDPTGIRIYIDDVWRKITKLCDEKDLGLLYNHAKYRMNKLKLKYNTYRNISLCLSLEQSKKFINNNNIIYFPHQYHVESRVTIRGKPYYNFDWILEYVSRSTPHDYELVVKPHPVRLSEIPNRLMRELSNHLTFVNPELNSHDIIDKSSAVVTINNTVGYEALLHGATVLCLGNAFYSGCGYTIDVANISQLEEYLHNATDANGLSYNQRLEVAHRTLEGSYPGVWGESDDENVRNVAESVLQKIPN